MPVTRARRAAQLRECALHGRLAANRSVNREFHDPGIYPYFPDQPGYAQVLENSPERLINDNPSTPGLGVRLAATRVRPFLWAKCEKA
jgi:hypothetical protein